jgi:hypothetical protein
VSAVAVEPLEDLDERERLDHEMNTACIRLMLFQHGNTQSFSGIGGGHASSKPPSGDSHPVVDELVRLYERALSNAGRAAVLARATAELQACFRKRVQVPDEKSVDELVIDDGLNFPPKMVAERYGLSAAHVCRIRVRAGRDALDGTLTEVEKLRREERQKETRRMRNANISTRHIADTLKVSQSQVMLDLKACP